MEWWAWALVAAAVAVALFALDRLVARGVFDRRRPKQFSRPGAAVAGGALGELIEIFQPTHHTLVEERARQEADADVPGDAAPPAEADDAG